MIRIPASAPKRGSADPHNLEAHWTHDVTRRQEVHQNGGNLDCKARSEGTVQSSCSFLCHARMTVSCSSYISTEAR
jgi:hypothetical protein